MTPQQEKVVQVIANLFRFVHTMRAPNEDADARLAVESMINMGYAPPDLTALRAVETERDRYHRIAVDSMIEADLLRTQLQIAEDQYREAVARLWLESNPLAP